VLAIVNIVDCLQYGSELDIFLFYCRYSKIGNWQGYATKSKNIVEFFMGLGNKNTLGVSLGYGLGVSVSWQ
jgi:hypothetical protein